MASATVAVKILADASDAVKGFRSAGEEAETFGQKASKFAKIAGAAIGVGVVAALPGLKKLGDELKIMGDKAATVFGDQLEPMQKWAAENNKAMGLSKEATLDLATSMSDLLIPMGFTREAAAEQSKEMVGAAAALSAWSKGKFTSAEVSDIMTKAILGETDGLKALGISISAAEIDARLLAKGQKALTGEALAQAKALATQELMMEKSTDAQKAWTDGTMDAVKQQNELKAKQEEVKASLATALQPAFAALTALLVGTVIPAVEKITGFFKEHQGVAIAVAAVIGALTVAMIANAIATQFATGTGAVYAVTQGIITVATSAWAAAQWLLNVAMSANPIGLVVIAIAALVAGVVLAYKNFDWFREAIDKCWEVLQTAFKWVQDNWPLILTILTGPFGLAVVAIVKNFDTIRETFADVYGFFVLIKDKIYNAIKGPFEDAFNFVKSVYDHSIGPIIDALKWVGDRFGGTAGPGSTQFGSGPGGATVYGGGRAMGGPALAGHAYTVGERGPETLVMGSRSGNITPNGGGNIYITVNAPVGSSAYDIGRQLQGYLHEFERRGGR